MAITIHGSKKRLDAVWWLSFSSSIGLFLVNVSGFVDTETGSALGCGHQWPLCNDQFIPTLWNEHTLFEFAHRVLVLLIAVFLISTVIAVWHRYGSWLEVRVLAWISMGFVILESVIGAIAVLLPTVSPAILAITLGVSLLSFVGNVLLTVVLSQIQRRPSFGSEVSLHLRACEIPPPFYGVVVFHIRIHFSCNVCRCLSRKKQHFRQLPWLPAPE
ncbi:hypothetical protein [Ferroacidibacillus organovorans]|uniref:Cytochrome oxidase assembly protein n=1 Tax=Ferroacidibacillus organovorans TaxID=1765683 RepID=A0A101XPT1_9BACL|nr:hypothetical protein [Ferroacidibacillus organovorans]KUO95335.1 hypothetical protein ATW55_04430 [Ferroacidibacillus organovorans]